MIALLSTGTELTTGQILNKNAQWLSSELLKLGIPVSFHLTTPDDRELILASLRFLESRCKAIIVTGGLGPTADDFTRNIISEAYSVPLQWNEDNWQKVQSKLNKKGTQVRDLHRQQCEFPMGAEILPNEAGIADGFALETIPTAIYALPGPPKEVASIWEQHLKDRLMKLLPDDQRWSQKIWTTKGLPESEVAAKVNSVLGKEGSQVLYRAHSPFIDVKLLFQNRDSEYNNQIGAKIQDVLSQWLVPQEDIHD